MEVIKGIQEIQKKIKKWKDAGESVGFVPTMGYLHRGHGSLIERAASENDRVVVSVFLNPMQFDNCNDLDSYPSDLSGDMDLVTRSGGDLIFNPTVQEIYPRGFNSLVEVENLDNELCGATKPGHFRGVCTVLTKFFLILAPQRVYFGKKDYQQLMVVKRMVADLNIPLEIVGCTTVREEGGLAMSSRNARLSEDEKRKALIINQTLKTVKGRVIQGETEVEKIRRWAVEKIEGVGGAVVDYLEIVHADTLQKITKIEDKAVAATAVFIGKSRLIDNIILGGKDETTDA